MGIHTFTGTKQKYGEVMATQQKDSHTQASCCGCRQLEHCGCVGAYRWELDEEGAKCEPHTARGGKVHEALDGVELEPI